MKLNMIMRPVFFGIVTIALSPAAHADILTQYKFTGADEASRIVATTVDSNVTASNWELAPTGSGWSTSPGTSSNTSANETGDPANSGSIFARSNYGTIASTNPETTDTFMGFSLTVGTLGVGETLNITGFDYSIFATGLTSGNAYYVGLYSDLTGFTIADKLNANVNRTGNGVTNESDDLSDEAALQGLTSGQVVNFRLYLGDNMTNTSKIPRLDNITINGTVIPEPATLGLITAFGGGILFIRRLWAI